MFMLEFRPHHFLCTLGFEGKGYSPPFIKNYQQIVDRIHQHKGAVNIQVTLSADSICRACPHKRDLSCAQQEKIARLDSQHMKALNLKDKEILSWNAGVRRIKECISIETFHKICDGCEWKSLGICERALNRLRLSK